MTYLKSLRLNQLEKQKQIEDLLEKNKAQTVGHGYIDAITDFKHIESLISGLSQIGIAIDCVTWWCHCSEENKVLFGCPHGLGGPHSIHFDGWFSEIGIDNESFDIPSDTYQKREQGKVSLEEIRAINDIALVYIRQFTEAKRFSQCFKPAVWLHVPVEWRRDIGTEG